MAKINVETDENVDKHIEFYIKYDIPSLFYMYLDEKLKRAEAEYD